MGTPRFHQIGKRRLAYEVHGHGRIKCFFFHGFPGSRDQGHVVGPFADAYDLQIVAFDRPGYGDSDFVKEDFVGVGRDLISLADELGWQKFNLIAVSGGAPYAINLAATCDRVTTLHVVCGLGPLEDLEFQALFSKQNLKMLKAADLIPSWIVDRMVKSRLKRVTRQGSRENLMRGLDRVDNEILTQPQFKDVLNASLANAFKQGAAGAKQDLRNYLKAWPAQWHRVNCPAHFWHGDLDYLVPTNFSKIFCARIPGAQLHIVKGEGHYSLPLRHQKEILEQIRVSALNSEMQ